MLNIFGHAPILRLQCCRGGAQAGALHRVPPRMLHLHHLQGQLMERIFLNNCSQVIQITFTSTLSQCRRMKVQVGSLVFQQHLSTHYLQTIYTLSTYYLHTIHMHVWDDKGRLEDIRVPDFPFPLGTAASSTVLYCTVLYCTVLYCTLQTAPTPGGPGQRAPCWCAAATTGTRSSRTPGAGGGTPAATPGSRSWSCPQVSSS